MKALFLSFALLVCVFFSMSAFPVIKRHESKTTAKSTTTWPVTGLHAGYNYTIYGSGNTPAYISFTKNGSTWGPFVFMPQGGSGLFTASIPSTSPVYSSITAVDMAVYTSQEGYVLVWHPDL